MLTWNLLQVKFSTAWTQYIFKGTAYKPRLISSCIMKNLKLFCFVVAFFVLYKSNSAFHFLPQICQEITNGVLS